MNIITYYSFSGNILKYYSLLVHIIRAAPTQGRKLNCINHRFSVFGPFIFYALFAHHPLSSSLYFQQSASLGKQQKHPRPQGIKTLNRGLSSGAVFRSTHHCPSLPVILPIACLYCSSELSSLHVKGVNRLMLPCQQARRSSLKPVQWPWILFNFCSPCLAKIIQLSKIKMIFFFLAQSKT